MDVNEAYEAVVEVTLPGRQLQPLRQYQRKQPHDI